MTIAFDYKQQRKPIVFEVVDRTIETSALHDTSAAIDANEPPRMRHRSFALFWPLQESSHSAALPLML